jgi:glycosyltransferase involved in cell wall biosynthesis
MPPRIDVIHNGIDLERYRPSPEASPHSSGVVIAAACRLVPGKGLPELIRAFGRLAADEPSGVLRIAGQGPQRAELEDLAKDDTRVELVGVVDDMPRFWRACDVAVTPSTLPESFGLTAVEAMAVAKPVVATRHGGIVEVVEEGVTGRLVTPGSIDELAGALRGYARDPDERRRHGHAGRERCEALFDADRSATRYAELVAELRKARRKPRN